MGFVDMANCSNEFLFAWLVEECGEVGRILIRGRVDKGTSLEAELADVYNVLMAIALKHNITPLELEQSAHVKGKTYFLQSKET